MLALAAMMVLVGCFAPGQDSGNASDTEYIPDDLPSGNCGETDNDPCESSGAEVPNSCQSTIECDAGRFCTAGFDGDIGIFACREGCIADFDETRWCVDDAGCCEPGSICQGRGYCVPAGATSSESGGAVETSTGEADTSATDTSGTSETSTDTGSTGSTTGGLLEPETRPIPR